MCQMLIKGKAEYSTKAKESTMMEFHLPEDYKDIQRPRVFNTHFTPICLPKKMADKKCKIVIIQRNPKDVFTSLYHHFAVIGMVVDNSTTFSEYLDYILKNGELLFLAYNISIMSKIYYCIIPWLLLCIKLLVEGEGYGI